jgi:hypothetical protein
MDVSFFKQAAFYIPLLVSAAILIASLAIFFQTKELLSLKNTSVWYKNDNGSIRWILVLAVGLTVIGFVFLLWFVYETIASNLIQSAAGSTTIAAWGQFGDFIGGFIGIFFTIVGVFLLYETLTLQREELKESRKAFVKQGFEDTLFKMISTYQDIVKDISVVDGVGNVSNGKDYFMQQKELFTNGFIPVYNIFQCNRDAISAYEEFYSINKNDIAHYYRTLYRIFRFIEDSEFDFKDKMRYGKTVRALLSEAELFFLYYNAHTDYGKNFVTLINKYNIIKHLPILEKLEFRWLVTQLDQRMRLAFSQLLTDMRSDCLKVLKEGNKLVRNYFQARVKIITRRKKNELILQIIMRREDFQPDTSSYQKGYGLFSLKDTDIREMLYNFLHEIVEFQNFRLTNTSKLIYKKTLGSNAGQSSVSASVSCEGSALPIINEDQY